ncbi:3-oxoacyl-[acyl-carrier-protein] synthase III C-terminal domain-containing protein [Aestuariibaculum suncheonense]|uniref:Type III polyketide synthase n=1 Tax=Aestuariibaculum suncheonense TaxID=1028745 RepID=A0A8J6QEE6_9FLAO|nr:3-oxoacyl-[acyl-carrier-protein] synthase III C-terminal domain-containing protein [Aestuariibaculum suncheonense]MBD0835445.1 type III polyketide synthase [Aestuariibaculum suncheonense]
MNAIILSNFHPILVGKLINQNFINQYTKFLYHFFQNTKANKTITFKDVSDHVDRYAVSSANIEKRQVLLFDEIEHFIVNEMADTDPSKYIFPVGFEFLSDSHYGPKIEMRMDWFKKKLGYVFDKFYEYTSSKPENIIHVTCSGYSSPSLAQEAVINRNWSDVKVTHSYHMGCYGAFPAIRTGSGLLSLSETKGRVDIIHTELLSVHLNLTEFSAANTMICSLFSDGFIGYSLYDENKFYMEGLKSNKAGLKILASHEVIIPDTLEDMTWDLGEYSFLMTLSKRVPVFIRKNIKNFIVNMCDKIGFDFELEKDSIYYAIHPGGPKIIDYVVNELNIDSSRAYWSYDVLKHKGNMSSATVPHIFQKIINDPEIKVHTKVIAIAFGPGLTATGLLLEKIA